MTILVCRMCGIDVSAERTKYRFRDINDDLEERSSRFCSDECFSLFKTRLDKRVKANWANRRSK
jgi:hypothetical protein